MAQPLLKTAQNDIDPDKSSFDAIRDMMNREAALNRPSAGDRHVFDGKPQDLSRPVALGLSHPEIAPLRRPGQYSVPPAAEVVSGKGQAGPQQIPYAETLEDLRPSRLRMMAGAVARRGGLVLVWVLAAAAFVLKPMLMLGAVIVVLGFLVTSYLTLGYDAFWRRALRPVRWYVARHPDRAGRVHDRIDRLAFRWDAFLDRLPERLVAGLYLPDVSDIAAVADEDETPIDLRLSGLGQI